MASIPATRLSRPRIRLSHVLAHTILAVISLACLLPLVLVVAASFSDEEDIALYGYALIPRHFTMAAYDYILKLGFVHLLDKNAMGR